MITFLGPLALTLAMPLAHAASLAGDLERARELFYRQLPLLDFILKGGLPATIKAGLRLTGLEAGDPRLPVFPLGETAIEQLKTFLR